MANNKPLIKICICIILTGNQSLSFTITNIILFYRTALTCRQRGNHARPFLTSHESKIKKVQRQANLISDLKPAAYRALAVLNLRQSLFETGLVLLSDNWLNTAPYCSTQVTVQ